MQENNSSRYNSLTAAVSNVQTTSYRKPRPKSKTGDISKQSPSPLHHTFLLGRSRFTAQPLSPCSSFSRPAARAPRRAFLQAIRGCNGQEWIDCYGDSMAEWLARRTPVVPGSSPAPITSWIYYFFVPIANPPSSLYSQLLPCRNPSITDTPIKRTAAKSQQKYIRDV